jgi:adenosylhomocysteinase
VPEQIDKKIAREKLATMNVAIDTLTSQQKKYLASWDMGT